MINWVAWEQFGWCGINSKLLSCQSPSLPGLAQNFLNFRPIFTASPENLGHLESSLQSKLLQFDIEIELFQFCHQTHSFSLGRSKASLLFWCLNKDIHCMFVKGKPRTVFFLQTLYLRHLSRRLVMGNLHIENFTIL